MMGQEAEDAKVRADLGHLAREVGGRLPYGWGFVVLAFPFGVSGRMNYVANANRADVVRAMYEFIEVTKGVWAEHEPEQSSAAEDEQLGRARQRIAELEGILRKIGYQEAFFALLSVMDTEELIRIRHRLGKKGWKGMVGILTLEIARREKGESGPRAENEELAEEMVGEFLNRTDPGPGP